MEPLVIEILTIVATGVGIIITVIKLSKYFAKHEQSKPSPLQILDERYAKGEITEEEYDKKKKKLTDKNTKS